MKRFFLLCFASVQITILYAGIQRLSGTVFHTTYHITYLGDSNYQCMVDSLFRDFDGSLSMFNDTSILSRMNRNEKEVVANNYVRTVIEKSLEVSNATDGAFDITVAPLVNLWGFGFKHSDRISHHAIDSILNFVGYKTICLDSEGHLHKKDPRTILDASSIAKGYMCDVIADWFRLQGIKDYLVEIGGEIALNGTNPSGKPWGIAINVPQEDSLSVNNEIQNIIHLSSGAVATSGNYRNFYYKDGKRYAHTINPHTGYPIQSDILSSTVIAPDCITADAYATAFMVLGSDSAINVLEKHPELMAYFIMPADNGSDGFRVFYSPALRSLLKLP